MSPHHAPESNRAYWNRISGEYQQATLISIQDFHYGPLLPGDREIQLLPEVGPESSCLELGAGAGQNSIFLAHSGAACTVADIAEEQLKLGEQLALSAGVSLQFLQLDMEDYASYPAGPFDLIHSTFGLPFANDPAKVIRHAETLLKPGGVLLVSLGHPAYSGEWIELEEDEEGLLIKDFFHPDADIRYEEQNEAVSRSNYFPVSTMFKWFTAAGMQVTDLLEPQPLPVDSMSEEEIQFRIPYCSPGWIELYPVLSRVPSVVIFKAVKT